MGAVMIFGSSLLVACGSSSSSGTTDPTGGGAGTSAAGAGGSGTGGTGTAGTGTAGTGTAGTGTAGTGTAGTGTGGTAAAGKGGSGTGGTGTAGKAGSGTGGTAAAGAAGKAGAGGAAAGAAGMAGAGGSMLTAACDPTKGQDVCPMGQKCAATTAGTGAIAACEAFSAKTPANQPEGADCQRDVFGVDTCVAGTICTATDSFDFDSTMSEPKARTCKKWCNTTKDCGTGKACANFTDDGFGICINSCTPLEPCMGPKGASQPGTCTVFFGPNDPNDPGYMNTGFVPGCRKIGAGADGDACVPANGGSDCGKNYFCSSMSMTCTQLCDPTHTACDDKKKMCSGSTVQHFCASDNMTTIDGTCAMAGAMACPMAGDMCIDFDNIGTCQLSKLVAEHATRGVDQADQHPRRGPF